MGKAEILQQIKAAEEQVRTMVKDAEERRKQLQAEGKRRALEKIESADSLLKKQLEARTAEARARVEIRRKALLEEGAKKAEALSASAKRNSAKLKDFVLTEFERAADA